MAKAKSLAAAVVETFVLTDIQEVDMFIDKVIDAVGNPILDANGQPVGVENVTWTSSDPLILSVIVDPIDNHKAIIRTVGPLTLPDTAVQVTVSADLIIGEGEQIALSVRSFQVVASAAVGFSTGLGTARNRELPPA